MITKKHLDALAVFKFDLLKSKDILKNNLENLKREIRSDLDSISECQDWHCINYSGVQDIYYNVSDMKKSIIFYTEALQMKLQFEDDGWTFLIVEECRLVFILLKKVKKS